MKATIEIPDDLYQRVEAKSASEGRPVDVVAAELFRRWLDEAPSEPQRTEPDGKALGQARLTRRQRAEQLPKPEWLEDWIREADEAFRDAPPGPTAREILEEGRNRLERR